MRREVSFEPLMAGVECRGRAGRSVEFGRADKRPKLVCTAYSPQMLKFFLGVNDTSHLEPGKYGFVLARQIGPSLVHQPVCTFRPPTATESEVGIEDCKTPTVHANQQRQAIQCFHAMLTAPPEGPCAKGLIAALNADSAKSVASVGPMPASVMAVQ